MVGGAGYRSRYLSHAKRALYHLSYAPILIGNRKFQVFIFQGIFALQELTFKEQYLGRSDMWRLTKSLKESGVYLNKKIEFGSIRCQVNEMWSQGYRVSSGVVSADTKVVFRSPTAMVYLFIQMSSGMTRFLIHKNKD